MTAPKTPSRDTAASGPATRATVMIVHGQPANAAALEGCLAGLDLEILPASTGSQALEYVAERDVAFILLELDLPDLDGFEVTRLIRGDHTKQHIPIVLLTPQERSEAIMYRAYEAGVIDFLTFPYQRGLVLAKTRLYLDLYHSRHRVELQKAALERSNSAFRDFSHAAAHDLRAPLRTIKAFAEHLLASDDEEEQRELAERIASGAKRMDELLRAMLYYADAGGSCQMQKVDLEHVLGSVADDLDDQIRATAASLHVAPLPSLTGDEHQLRRLVQNLVGNALKYRRPDVPPEVTVTCGVEAEAAVLKFIDNVTGFDPARAAEVFQPFRRLVSGEIEGSGIGLATAAKIVEAHGGTITASSRLGVGSTFTVTLPMSGAQGTDFEQRQRAAASATHASRPAPTPSRVLVVDDDEADRLLTRLALREDFDLLFASSADEANQLIDATVGVVITDNDMPGRNGISLLTELSASHPCIRRILVSSVPNDACRAALDSGIADALFEKPIDAAQIAGALDVALRGGVACRQPSDATQRP
ncbi:MAG: response regulator [Planctomycetota bacterium]